MSSVDSPVEHVHGYQRHECPIFNCDTSTPSVAELLSHLSAVHRCDPHFDVVCGIEGCCKHYTIFSSLKSHVYRHHREHVLRRRPTSSETAPVATDGVVNDNDTQTGVEVDHSLLLHPVADDGYMQHEIDQLLGTDKLARKRSCAMFLLDLKEGRSLSQVALTDVISGCERVVKETVERLKAGVSHRLSSAGINPSSVAGLEDLFSQSESPFNGLTTKHLQHQFYVKHLGMIVSL